MPFVLNLASLSPAPLSLAAAPRVEITVFFYFVCFVMCAEGARSVSRGRGVRESVFVCGFFLNNTPSLFVGQIFICGDR
jgi:hypothetical protein